MTHSPQRNSRFRLPALLSVRTTIILLCLMVTAFLGTAFAMDHKTIFLPGQTSEGHYLFEESCWSCHEGFKPVSNETCNRCHQAELAKDVHGPKKFRDPRWAAELDKLAVLTCTTCHEEHLHMFGRGVNLKPDLCMTCHQGIITGDLKSHDGFSPDGCWTAGCHNFHDHRTISTGFIRQNIGTPDMLPKPSLPVRTVTTAQTAAPDPDLSQELMGAGT